MAKNEKQSEKEQETITRVYKYGAVPLKQFLEVKESAIDELFKANRLWNKLVELHRLHRDKFNEARIKAHSAFGTHEKKIKAKNEQINAAYDAKRTARMKAGTKDANHPLIEAENIKIKELQKQRKNLYLDRKVLAREADEKLGKDGKKQLSEAFKQDVKTATVVKNSGINNEIANTINRRFRTARDQAFKNPAAELKFHKFDGTGFWHYEHALRETDPTTGKRKDQNGTTLRKLLVGNHGFEKDDRAFTLQFKKQKGKRAIYELRAKISGGATKASKLYGHFDLIMHRPLPENAQIQNIELNRYRNGDKFTYAATFALRMPKPKLKTIPQRAIGVDLGFRKFFDEDGRIRIAAIATIDGQDDGKVSFIDLPTTNWQKDNEKAICDICGKSGHNSARAGDKNNYLRRIEYLDCLKSKMDDSATELGKKIIPLIKSSPPVSPDESKDWITRIKKWPKNITLSFEDAYKMHRWLMREPEKAALLGASIADPLRQWWQKNSLSYREMHNLRQKTLADRREYYRIEANKLVQQGLPIIFEKLNLSFMAKTRDSDNRLGNKARYQRFIGSPSEFRDAVKNAADREGIAYKEVNPSYTSKNCSACGTTNKQLKAEPEWVCQACGVVHDRDHNAAINIARRGLEQLLKESKKPKQQTKKEKK